MLKISCVLPEGIGAELGFEAGDMIAAFNGIEPFDELDYLYYDGQSDFSVTLLSNGESVEIEIEKDDDESLGLEFEDGLKTISCRNKCIFCFVAQLPKKMRKTLYVKDDDWRLSLIAGNYVTLTNADEKAIDRMIRMRMSPLYISVHAIDPDVRCRMLGNDRAGNLLEIMQRLSRGGIEMHCQIVLCPQYNDGAQLEKTLAALVTVDGVKSVAVVPVGLTNHREKLPHIHAVSEATARETIELCKKYDGKVGVMASDEMYQLANIELPPYEAYGDFSQIENGVGLVAKFIRELEEAKIPSVERKMTVVLATGVSAKKFILRAAALLEGTVSGLKVDVRVIENNFFGRSITVTGLITGGDLVAQLAGVPADRIVIPKVMLREFGNVFLDDMSLADVQTALGVPMIVADGTAQGLIDAVLQ